MTYTITLIPVGGTRPKIAKATRRVLEATGVPIEWDVQEAGTEGMARPPEAARWRGHAAAGAGLSIWGRLTRRTASWTKHTHTRVEIVAEELASLSNEELEQLGHLISRKDPQLIRRLEDGAEAPPKKHSVMELEGLGADIWRSIDVDQYLKRERDSWR